MNPEFETIKILILLISVIIHEVMHGVAALRFGDHTAERAGRLTFNPIPHIDLMGTILVPSLIYLSSGGSMLFGWAKPVPVNPLHFSNLRLGELVVSAAGILSNFALAIIGAILFHLSYNFFPNPHLIYTSYALIQVNLLLGVFNLIPIPPLDGSKILMSQLSYTAAREFSKIEPYGFFLILGLGFIQIGGQSVLSTFLGYSLEIFKNLLFIPQYISLL